jgi:hypothetical protein
MYPEDYYFRQRFGNWPKPLDPSSKDKWQVLREKNKQNKPDPSHDAIVPSPSFNRN